MKRKMILIALIVVTLGAVLSLSDAPTSAKPADAYTIDWYAMDNGGAMSTSNGAYALSGTIGDAEAGAPSGGTYKLSGGFWSLIDSLRRLFLPLITR